MTKTLDNMDMENEFETMLKTMDEYQNVIRAIEAKDLATVVRAALRALLKSNKIGKLARKKPKSAKMSNRYRTEGNQFYRESQFIDARESYTKALAYAPNNSLEMKFAYGNISAALLRISSFKASKLNLRTALEMGCPEPLHTKLTNRMIKVDKHILNHIVKPADMSGDEDLLAYANLNVERNADIPCVSKDVSVDDNKNVVAAKHLKSGTMVAVERAYVYTQDTATIYRSCYYCHKLYSFLVPCEGCSKALFCSKECKERCIEEYHRVECCFVNTMYKDYIDHKNEPNKLAYKAAIQLSLKLGWDALRVASLDMGENRFRNSSVAEAFDCDVPTSILCYDDRVTVPVEEMINKSFYCAKVIHLMRKVPNYWPEDEKEKEDAIDSLSRVILHLNSTFKRRVVLPSTLVSEPGGARHAGWFSFSSKLAHSCEPNLILVGAGHSAALVTIERIKKGDPLTISYVDHFYDMTLAPSPKNTCLQQQMIKTAIDYHCECRVCLLEWEINSPVRGRLTSRQKAAYKRCKRIMKRNDSRMEVGAGLDELTGCMNTLQHRTMLDNLKQMVCICIYQCVMFLKYDQYPL